MRNGGICRMMSNSTLPLGFIHKISPTGSIFEAVGFYFDIFFPIKFFLITNFCGCNEIEDLQPFLSKTNIFILAYPHYMLHRVFCVFILQSVTEPYNWLTFTALPCDRWCDRCDRSFAEKRVRRREAKKRARHRETKRTALFGQNNAVGRRKVRH